MTTPLRSVTYSRHPAAPRPQPASPARRAVYRQRDLGVGYGNSSGYASERRYARDWNGQPHFRCA
ncbi:hypothetical protein MQC88_09760 [Luteimonas sp. 50]|uniref:Uncharacterized protein n=1 Tax=Cognatiluteimonas sedimenti TaxID=2927791 RepID=A0ABT0A5H7_9GAMM|nr:hypothetical protein [Lysobacter sedimenti]MCJ0826229.1 hypothetical protein [Lysobacter sedimenti]